MPPPITDSNIIYKIVDDFKNGKTKKEIGYIHNLSQPTIRKIVKDNFNQLYSRISDTTVNAVEQLSKTKKSKLSIAKELNIDSNTVSKILKDKSLSVLQYKPGDKEMTAIIEDYTKNLKSMSDISIQYNYCITNIRKWLKENNVIDYHRNLSHNPYDPDWLQYVKLARRLTGTTMRHYNLLSPDGYHWDHIISIYAGWQERIPAELIASRKNLELVTKEYNLSKQNKAGISKVELYSKFDLT
jgi:DNA-binding CsgD family transcriptional regulator